MEMYTRPNPNRKKNRRGAHSYLTSDEARVRIKLTTESYCMH